jgi:hypothetical protein
MPELILPELVMKYGHLSSSLSVWPFELSDHETASGIVCSALLMTDKTCKVNINRQHALELAAF